VAGEASHNCGGWIEDAIGDAAGILMSGRQGQTADFPIPALAHFGVIFRVGALYEGDRLRACAESPLARLCGTRARERMGMRALGLLLKLRLMTFGADRRARIIGRGGQTEEPQERQGCRNDQKINLPEYWI